MSFADTILRDRGPAREAKAAARPDGARPLH